MFFNFFYFEIEFHQFLYEIFLYDITIIKNNDILQMMGHLVLCILRYLHVFLFITRELNIKIVISVSIYLSKKEKF